MTRPFKINGVEIPTPDTYKAGIEDLSSEATGRTLDGLMHKDVVAVKDTYECTWNSLSWAQAAHILNLVNGKTQVSLTYADPKVPNTFITGTFYIGTRSISAHDLNDPQNAWQDLTMSFIEV